MLDPLLLDERFEQLAKDGMIRKEFLIPAVMDIYRHASKYTPTCFFAQPLPSANICSTPAGYRSGSYVAWLAPNASGGRWRECHRTEQYEV
jgi:hypothetical protein